VTIEIEEETRVIDEGSATGAVAVPTEDATGGTTTVMRGTGSEAATRLRGIRREGDVTRSSWLTVDVRR
jgi:hypothetical protein